MNAFAPNDVEPMGDHALCAADVIERARCGLHPPAAYERGSAEIAASDLDEHDFLRRLREAGL
jgi:hypothetical protein